MNYKTILLIIFGAFLTWSAINPKDYFTWFLEVVPAILGLFILILTYNRFKLTNLLYGLILIHCCILMIGGHYTYAEVPFFDWIKDALDLTRNNYDKVGHFAQGFVPALIIREILIRKEVVVIRKWLNFIIVSICMAISVTYEFIEWFVAEQTGESAESFLGTQGYIWDTQSDMLYATIGAIMALITLSKSHDKLLKKV
jgi:putative membrane protein